MEAGLAIRAHGEPSANCPSNFMSEGPTAPAAKARLAAIARARWRKVKAAGRSKL